MLENFDGSFPLLRAGQMAGPAVHTRSGQAIPAISLSTELPELAALAVKEPPVQPESSSDATKVRGTNQGMQANASSEGKVCLPAEAIGSSPPAEAIGKQSARCCRSRRKRGQRRRGRHASNKCLECRESQPKQ